MKATRQRERWKRIMLAAAIMSVVVVISATVYAVPPPAAGKSSMREVTVLDPFSLRTVAVPSAPRDEKLGSPPAPAAVRLVRPVRVPSRPPCRSAFKPDVDWRPTAG